MRRVVDDRSRSSTSEREREPRSGGRGSLEAVIQPSISPIPRGKGAVDGTEPGVGRDAGRLGARARRPGDTESKPRR